jgi:hypothetical protein
LKAFVEKTRARARSKVEDLAHFTSKNSDVDGQLDKGSVRFSWYRAGVMHSSGDLGVAKFRVCKN